MVISVLLGSEEWPLGSPVSFGCSLVPEPAFFHQSHHPVSHADTETPAQGLGTDEQGLHLQSAIRWPHVSPRLHH